MKWGLTVSTGGFAHLKDTGVFLLPLAMLWIGTDALSAPAAEVLQGKALYEARCFGCHSVNANRIGPMHANVFGRKAGSVSGFEYSEALRKSDIVWNEQTLNQWLTNPETMVPGQQMDVSVKDEKDRKQLITYLKTLSTPSAKN